MTKILELQLQHQSFHWVFRVDFPSIDWFDLLAVQGAPRSPPASHFEGINSLAFCLLYVPALTTVHDHWEDYSLVYMDLFQQSNVSVLQHRKFVITFLPSLPISWLQPYAVILEPKRKSITISTFSPSICHEIMAIILVLSQLFHSPPSPSTRGSSVPLRFLP